jgi:methionyl-tRNA formyltransferase
MQQTPKFAYFGTPSVASDTLEILLWYGFTPVVVVTSPDAPRGRGLSLTPSETKACALAHGIPVITPEKLDAAALASIAAYSCDYAIVVAYGKIFPKALIDAFPLGMLNVHYSLLPKYRGATPLEAALLAGERETGVTVQKVVEALDAGDIIAQKSVEIAPTETARELRERLVPLGAHLLADTLPAFLSGGVTPAPQDSSLASHTHKLKKEDGLLSLDAPAETNWNKYRAYADTIGTHFFKNGKRMKITSAEFAKGEFRVLRVIPDGKREISYAGFAKT